MSLSDWQISIISGSIGAAIPLTLGLVRDIWIERRRKKQIRDAICAELTLSRQALDQALKEGKTDERARAGELFISVDLPNYENFPLNTTFYDDITIEALATTVNLEALKNLVLTYNLINHFNSKRLRVIGGFWIEKATLSRIITQIDKTIACIKEDC